MNYIKLKQLIDSEPANANRSDAAIAQWLNSTKTMQLSSKVVTARGIMKILGATVGAGMLDKLVAIGTTNSAVKWVMDDIKQGGIDIGDSKTQTMLNMLVAASALDQATEVAPLTDSAMTLQPILTQTGFTRVDLNDIALAKAAI